MRAVDRRLSRIEVDASALTLAGSDHRPPAAVIPKLGTPTRA